jgi:hypothetical protein
VLRTPIQAPNANAHAERWVRTVRNGCLDRILILARHQLERVLRVYVTHYNEHRPYRSLDLCPPAGPRADLGRRCPRFTAATCSAASSTSIRKSRDRVREPTGKARLSDWRTGQLVAEVPGPGPDDFGAVQSNGDARILLSVGDSSLLYRCDGCMALPTLRRLAERRFRVPLTPEQRALYLHERSTSGR